MTAKVEVYNFTVADIRAIFFVARFFEKRKSGHTSASSALVVVEDFERRWA